MPNSSRLPSDYYTSPFFKGGNLVSLFLRGRWRHGKATLSGYAMKLLTRPTKLYADPSPELKYV